MRLAAISGVNGVFSDEDIAKVVARAKKARLTWKDGAATKTPTAKTAAKKAAPKAPAKKAPVAKTAAPRAPAKKAIVTPTAVKKAPAKKAAPRKAVAAT